jgi:hypothetical protein
MSVISTDTQGPKQFLADLVQAMGEAARTAQQATLDQCHSDATDYTERLRAGTSGGSGDLHRAAVADVRTIREQAKAAEERVRIVTEQRIARRYQRLEDELQEYQAAIETEVQSVSERLEAFEAEVAQVFEQLVQGTDPLSFVKIAARMPSSPTFADPDPEAIVRGLRQRQTQSRRAESLDRSRLDSGMAYAPRTHARPRSGQSG